MIEKNYRCKICKYLMFQYTEHWIRLNKMMYKKTFQFIQSLHLLSFLDQLKKNAEKEDESIGDNPYKHYKNELTFHCENL